MTDIVPSDTQTSAAWLEDFDLAQARARMPIVYINAIPVRVDETGAVTHVGLLLRMMPDGTISRAVVSGRVLWGERVRDSLVRHLEKDLGPVALPRIPTDPAPFTVVEYFPDASLTGFVDPRQHAVALAYVVPVAGDCSPTQEALDLMWFTPTEAVSERVRREMTGGQDRVVRLALAHAGCLP